MQNFPRDWDIVTKISYLQRKIIISSILYYDFDESPISDREYDSLSKQLVELQKDDSAKDSQYWYVFNDFDGTTGFDLRDRLNTKDREYLTHLAQIVGGKRCSKKEESKQKVQKGLLFSL